MSLRWSQPLFFLVLVSHASLSLAEERDPGRAQALFEEGRKALAERDYDVACARFDESQRLDPGTGTLMNLATCEEKQGRIAGAWLHWNEARDSLPVDDDRASYIAEQLDKLKPLVPYLTIKVAGALPEGGKVWLDGVEVEENVLDVAVPTNPGKHKVIVKAPGYKDRSYAVTLAERDKTELLVEPGKSLPRKEEPAAAATAKIEVAPEASASPFPRRTLGIAAGGVGVAGVLGGIVTGLMVNSAEATVEENCNASKQCNQEGLDAAERGDTLVVVNAVSWGVGLVGLGVGAYLILTDKKQEGPAQAVTVRGLPGGAALAYGGTF